MFASGAVIGLSVGGAIIKEYGQQATFFTIIPIAIGLLIVVSRFIRVTEEQEIEKVRQQEQQQLGVETKDKSFESKDNEKTNNKIGSKAKRHSVVDIKGAVTLATAVTSFLLSQFNEIGDEKAYVYLYPLDDLVIISHISTSSASQLIQTLRLHAFLHQKS